MAIERRQGLTTPRPPPSGREKGGHPMKTGASATHASRPPTVCRFPPRGIAVPCRPNTRVPADLTKRLLLMAVLIAGACLPHVPAPSEAAMGAAGQVAVVLEDDRLSLTISNSPWAAVIRELAAQTGLSVRVAPVPTGTVTIALERIEIEHALRRLFGPDASLVLLYRPASEAAGGMVLDEIRVRFPATGDATARSRDERQLPGRDSPSAPRSVRQQASPPTGAGDEWSPTLEHRDPAVRRKALDAIIRRTDGSGIDELREVLLGDESGDVRTRAAVVLGRIGTPEALEALRDALRDDETGVRATAVDAIAHFGTPGARALLEDALQDRDDEVRSVAAAALRQLRRGGR